MKKLTNDKQKDGDVIFFVYEFEQESAVSQRGVMVCAYFAFSNSNGKNNRSLNPHAARCICLPFKRNEFINTNRSSLFAKTLRSHTKTVYNVNVKTLFQPIVLRDC